MIVILSFKVWVIGLVIFILNFRPPLNVLNYTPWTMRAFKSEV